MDEENPIKANTNTNKHNKDIESIPITQTTEGTLTNPMGKGNPIIKNTQTNNNDIESISINQITEQTLINPIGKGNPIIANTQTNNNDIESISITQITEGTLMNPMGKGNPIITNTQTKNNDIESISITQITEQTLINPMGKGNPIIGNTQTNNDDIESKQSEDRNSEAVTTTLAFGATIASNPATTATEQSWLQKYAPYLTALVTAAAVLCGICCGYKACKRRRNVLPQEWRRVGTLKHIYAYPVKSCGPVTMTNAECTFLGIRDNWIRDRFLMVVDERNKHVSARSFPDLLTVRPSVDMSILTLQYKNMDPLHIDLFEVKAQGSTFKANVCDVSVPVKDCGPLASKWFSRLLNPQGARKYRLVMYASENSRQLTAAKQKIVYGFTKYDKGALSNEAPFSLINEASVTELNSRFRGCQVSARNFRPNFVISGATPFDEDKWKYVKIRETVFAITKPCYRCVMTTIDPDTTVRNPNHEPLETLKSYRQSYGFEANQLVDVGPRMGVQLALRAGSTLALEDPVLAAYAPNQNFQENPKSLRDEWSTQLNAEKNGKDAKELMVPNRSQDKFERDSGAKKTRTDFVSSKSSQESVEYEKKSDEASSVWTQADCGSDKRDQKEDPSRPGCSRCRPKSSGKVYKLC